ncbi:hypothetical protein AB4160_03070 [Shewanella sp. 10N.286.51.B8]|uniref:hypothetical protein n=1 Tax=Shewanella sp. 10N.286.51.B8 TaxID=3229708 RepID=UPI00354D44D5
MLSITAEDANVSDQLRFFFNTVPSGAQLDSVRKYIRLLKVMNMKTRIPNVHDLYVDNHNKEGVNLYIKGSVTEALLADIKDRNITALTLDVGDFGSLSFIHSFSDSIQKLRVSAQNVDWKSLAALKNLKVLRVSGDKNLDFDISCFKKLEVLQFQGNCFKSSISQLYSLKQLRINNWSEVDFSLLSNLSKLEKVRLVDALKLTTLNGLQCQNLQWLMIDRSPKLTCINALLDAKELRCLEFISTKAIESYNALQNCHAIFSLELIKCRPIRSLSAFRHMQQLQWFGFGNTLVEDFDLTPLFDFSLLKKCTFKNHADYNLTQRSLNKALKDKWGESVDDSDHDSFYKPFVV